jgi:hypothetical protein
MRIELWWHLVGQHKRQFPVYAGLTGCRPKCRAQTANPNLQIAQSIIAHLPPLTWLIMDGINGWIKFRIPNIIKGLPTGHFECLNSSILTVSNKQAIPLLIQCHVMGKGEFAKS